MNRPDRTALVFFSANGGSSDAGVNRDAFTHVLWWVGAAFVACGR